jgi:hypothetical protein
MKRKLILLVAVTLGGCLPDQSKNITICRTEADRFYQGYQALDADSPRDQYIIACMAAKGYEFTIASPDCDSRHALPIQPACYVPNNWFAWIVDKFRGH